MSTPNLGLATVPSNTLQPSVPINDSLEVIDALMRPGGIVQDKDLTTPPTTVSGDVGKTWIMTSAWAALVSRTAGDIALCTAATEWRYFTPTEGWLADVLDEGVPYRYSGSAWELAPATIIPAFVQVMLSDMTTDITTGVAKAVWFAPEDGDLADVWIGLHDPSSSGDVRIDMNDSGGTVFTTRPLIQATEATSLTGTAAVLDGTISFVKGDKFTFDIDDAGTDSKGLLATIEYTPT